MQNNIARLCRVHIIAAEPPIIIMGLVLSAISELNKMSVRGEELKKDTFFNELRGFAEKLPSFQDARNYCTTDYVSSFAEIKLKGSSCDEDEKQILEFLKNNPRDNWDVTIKKYSDV